MSILIRDVQVEGDVTQVYIEGNRIVEIGRKREADTVIDGKGKIALPGFLAEGIVALSDSERAAKQFRAAEEVNRRIEAMKTDRITPVLGPHAIYTVSKDSLLRIRELADKTGSLIHIHLSETKREVDDCLTETGARPAKYLDGLGFLAKDVIAAHGCWLDPSEIELLARTGTRVAHCPISNMKLSTGQAMPYAAMKEAAVVMGLGTDGAASNNNLDMFETMKVAALLQKFAHAGPAGPPAAGGVPAGEVGGRATPWDRCGVDRRRPPRGPHPRRPAPAGAPPPPQRHQQLGLFRPRKRRGYDDLRRRRVDARSPGPRRSGNPREGRRGRTGSRLEGLRWPSTGCAPASRNRPSSGSGSTNISCIRSPTGSRWAVPRSSMKCSPNSPGSATGAAATRSSRRNRWASRSPPDWRCASGNRTSSSASVSMVCPERCRSSRRPAIRRRTCSSTTSSGATASSSSTT